MLLLGALAAWAAADPPYIDVASDYLLSEPLTSAGTFPAEHPAVESQGAPGVAWQRGIAKQVSVTIQNPTSIPHSAPATITGTYYSASGTFSVSSDVKTFVFTAGGSDTQTFTLTGLPNFVTLGNVVLMFSIESEYASLLAGIGTKLYLIEAAPRPSPQGDMVPVWTDVLDDACLWATGQSSMAACAE